MLDDFMRASPDGLKIDFELGNFVGRKDVFYDSEAFHLEIFEILVE